MSTTERDILKQRIHKVEWCSLSDVARRLKFPFPVMVVGWNIAGNAIYRGIHRGNGTEFCIRLVSSEAMAVDVIGGRRYELPFPHVIMKRPGERHEYRALGWREAFFIIYPRGTEAALRRAGVDDGIGALPAWPLGAAPEVFESIREMRALFPHHREPRVADELDARCWALVTRLVALRDEAAAGANRGGVDKVALEPSDDDRVRAFSADLPSRCLKPVDFAEEARALGLSRSGFYRRFSALVGEPPERHLWNLRLDAAARLLRESQFSVKQVAFAVCDKSPAHFCRAFRARFGVSPLAWRNGAGSVD